MSLFFNIDRPAGQANSWNTFAGNIFLLLFSGGILLAAFFFPIDRFPLGFCVFLNLTGAPCPTCGFSRAFCAFAHGNWEQGILNCPFALIVFILTLLIFIYNAIVLLAALFGIRIQRGSLLNFSPKKMIFIVGIFVLLLLGNWIYRLVLGLK